MSTVIDQRAVEMRFDNSQFERGVSQTIDSTNQLKKSLDFSSVGNSMGNITKSAQKVTLEGISSQVQNVSLAFEILGNYVANILTGMTNNAVMYGKKIFTALAIQPAQMGFQEYETQMQSIQTILANTSKEGTNLQQVSAALDELNLYADRTIYNFTEMARNIGTFTAAGVELDTSVAAIKGIANLAAVSGSNSQQASTAMYQLSQALAAGTIRLMDWNSVVNAGMGGQVFQDALMETARVHGIAIDQMVESEGSFRETLQHGWLSAEVMTETLAKFTGDLSQAQLAQMGYNEEQIEQIMELGQMANDAATQVKTFTQLVSTLKEAAQSGWAQSWRLIVGDFEESKVLFTDISNTLGGIINEASTARNEMLLGGLGTGWKQFLNEGIGDEAGYIDSITRVAEQHGIVVGDLVEEYGTFENSLETGWLSADIMRDALEDLTAQTRDLSEEQLEELGYTNEQVTALRNLNVAVQSGIMSIDDVAASLDDVSGRQNVVDGLWNSFEGVLSVIEPVKRAFENIFPAFTAENLYDLTVSFKELTESFVISEQVANKIERTFKGVFAVFDIVRIAVVEFATALFPALSNVSELSDSVLDITASMGDWLVDLRDVIKETGFFSIVMDKIASVAGAAYTGIKELFSYLQSKISFDIFDSFSTLLDSISNRVGLLELFGEKIERAITVVVQTIQGLILNNGVWHTLFSIYVFIKDVARAIFEAIADLFTGMSEAISNADFSTLFAGINTASFSAMAIGIGSYFVRIVDIIEEFLNTVGRGGPALRDLLDQVGSALTTWQDSIRANTIRSIAISVGILAASLWVLASIDSEKMTAAIASITVLFGELLGAMALFSLITKDAKNILTVAPALIMLSVSIFILAAALQQIAYLEPEQLATGIIGIASLMGAMILTVLAFSKMEKAVIKAAKQLIFFAIAIDVLASAVVKLSSVPWDDMWVSIGAIATLMLMTSLFARFTEVKKNILDAAFSMIIIGVAMHVMASAIGDLSQYDLEELAKGLGAIGIFLIEFSLMAKILSGKNQANLISAGISIAIISASMIVLAIALERLVPLPLEQLAKSMGAIAIGLAAMTVALRLLPEGPKMLASAGAIAILSGSLYLLAETLTIIGQIDPDSLYRALFAIGVGLGMFAIALQAMEEGLRGAIVLAIVSASILVFAGALYMLGSMDIAQIVVGFVSIAAGLTLLAVAGILLYKALPALLGFAKAMSITAYSVSIFGVGLILISTGIILFGVGLASVAAGFTALVAALSAGAAAFAASISVIVTGILVMVPDMVEAFGELLRAGIEALGIVLVELVDQLALLIVALIDALVALIPDLAEGILMISFELITYVAKYIPLIVDALGELIVGILEGLIKWTPPIIIALLELIVKVFDGVFKALEQFKPEIIQSALKGFGAFLLLLAALNLVYVSAPGAILGLIALSAIVTALTVVLVAFGKLALIPGLIWLVNEGAVFLGAIGNAIGAFIGGIAGGVIGGVSAALPQLGSDLSSFIQNAKVFIDTASNIDESVFTGTTALIGAILAITAANVINGIATWLTGGASIADFGKELAEFGPYFNQYYESIKNIKPDVIEASANAALALTEMALNLPNTGGLIAAFTGDNSLTAFAEELIPFGAAMRKYDATITGITPEVIIASATAATALAEMAGKLPNTGGLVAAFTGENSMTTFAEELVPFGQAMRKYDVAITGIKPEVITASATAALALAEMAEKIPNTGGLVAAFTGENSMVDFAKALVPFGEAMRSYDKAITGIRPEVITESATAAMSLVELAQDIPNMGGLISVFTGDNDFGEFGNQLTLFGKGLKNYSLAITGIKAEFIIESTTAGQALSDLAQVIPNSGGLISLFTGDNDFGEFGNQLTLFGAGMKSYSNAVNGIKPETIDASIDTAKKLIDLGEIIPENASWFEAETGLPALGEALLEFGPQLFEYYQTMAGINYQQLGASTKEVKELVLMAKGMVGVNTTLMGNFGQALTELGNSGIDGFISAFEGSMGEVRAIGDEMINTLITSAENKRSSLVRTFTQLMESVLTAIRNKNNAFRTAGSTLITNFLSGITSKTTSVNQTITNLGNTMVELLNSKQSLFRAAGSNLMTAFNNGLESNQTNHINSMLDNMISQINSKYQTFRQSGKYLVEGFAQGISDNTFLAEARAIDMANAAANAAKKTLDERSPSRVGYGIGNFFGVGFINGISELTSDYISVGQNMANDARKGLSGFVTQIAESIEDGIDLNPVITPVLDLTNFNSASRSLGSLLAVESVDNLNASISGNRNAIQTTSAPIQQTNITMNQTNNSPKALSRIDIYRNTRNQISKVKDMVNK